MVRKSAREKLASVSVNQSLNIIFAKQSRYSIVMIALYSDFKFVGSEGIPRISDSPLRSVLFDCHDELLTLFVCRFNRKVGIG
jgi:hypothetical protein